MMRLRKWFGSLSIRHKILAFSVTTSTISVLVTGFLFVGYDIAATRKVLLKELKGEAEVIAANCSAALAFNDVQSAAQTLQTLKSKRDIVAAVIVAADGKIFANYRRSGTEQLQIDLSPDSSGDDSQTQPLIFGHVSVSQPVTAGEESIGKAVLVSSMETLRERIRGYLAVAAVVMAIATLLGYLLSLRLQQPITRPIMNLAWTMTSVSTGKNYSMRGERESDDEIGLLIDNFNEMLSQIERRDLMLREKIEERKRAEESLRAALAEKETLLQEIHHRVKNNLMVVMSLLGLQKETISDPEVLKMLGESQQRISSIALAHEKLYQSADHATIDFAAYLDDFSRQLVTAYSVRPGIHLSVQGEEAFFGIDTIIPCGLIVNELVSNALRHGFPDGSGEIRITFVHEGPNFVLTISDNGVGMETPAGNSLGLRLAEILAGQLNGTLVRVPVAAGTTFRLWFPDPTV